MRLRSLPYSNSYQSVSKRTGTSKQALYTRIDINTTPLPSLPSLRLLSSTATIRSEQIAYMGDNIVNFYAGQPPLNRIAFQRHSSDHLNKHLNDSNTKFILFKDGKPLVHKGELGKLVFLSKDQVSEKLGPDFYTPTTEDLSSPDRKKWLEAARLPHTLAPLIFLGIDDRSDPTTNASSAVDHLNPKGTPYFALSINNEDNWLPKGIEGEWGEARSSAGAMSPWEAGLFAQGRALVDWNSRNKFCPACGSPTYSLWGGWKRNCTSSLEPPVQGKEPCFSLKGLHNFAYPRTDPVIIMGILNDSGDKILLGRQKSWPKGMYSCLAGFIEPGESFEDAVRREVLEEAGIEVGPVRYSSSQPWPYPSNLMVGCFGRARDGQTIRLDLDNELEDAQWFPRSMLSKIISSPSGSVLTKSDYKKFDNNTNNNDNKAATTTSDAETSAALAPSENKPDSSNEKKGKEVQVLEGLTRVPPDTAIAGQLIRVWAKGGLDLVSKL